MAKIYTVESPARIHLGFMELDNTAPRLFGSAGLAINKFRNKQKIELSKKFEVFCNDQEIKAKIQNIIKLFSQSYKIKKCRLTVIDFIPLHHGLGSGTQISLGTGLLISKLNALNLSINEISNFLGRGRRSGIGVQTFKSGGFVIDLGKKKKSTSSPLGLLNLKWPKNWEIILIMDKKFLGLHGLEETREFSKLKNINSKFAKENCYNILMKIIPGLIENDFDPFVEGIQKIQENMSKIFYGKKYNYSSENISRIFNFLKHENHLGFGQSSWGPSSFIFCKNKTKRDELLNKMENFIELKKIEGINFIMVKGRNFGNNKKRINDD